VRDLETMRWEVADLKHCSLFLRQSAILVSSHQKAQYHLEDIECIAMGGLIISRISKNLLAIEQRISKEEI
jgi:hypothetical protein